MTLAGVKAPTIMAPRRQYAPKRFFLDDPKWPQPYRLRLARYVVLAQDIDDWAGTAAAAGRELSVLDVGCGWGPLLVQLVAEPHFANIAVSGADVVDAVVHHRELYREFFIGDLTEGYPEIRDERYDVVVCEQVLEHLDRLDDAIATLTRVTRPGGIVVIGVPIFVPPLHLARKYLVPRLGWLLRHRDTASHQQAFSLRSFLRVVRRRPELTLLAARGFRVISGGLLRPLENWRWWWRLNRRIGELAPSLCIEVQLVLRKAP